jgi:copper(I)-binding protein
MPFPSNSIVELSSEKNRMWVIIAYLIFNLISFKGVACAKQPHNILTNMQRHPQSETISIIDPWARASFVSTSATFMQLKNNQEQEDTLIGAASDICEIVELHTHIKEGDIMRMRPLKGGIKLAANHTVSLKPGGLHIMLMGLKRPLLEGEHISLKLHFQKAGIISLRTPIRKFNYQTNQNQMHCGCKHNPSTPTATKLYGR